MSARNRGDLMHHLAYEIWMLNRTGDLVHNRYMLDVTNFGYAVEDLVAIESFVVHARVLIEFFHDRKKRNYVRAADFVTPWKHALTAELKEARSRANTDAVHFGPGRVRADNWRWHTEPVLTDLNKAVIKLLQQMKPDDSVRLRKELTRDGLDPSALRTTPR